MESNEIVALRLGCVNQDPAPCLGCRALGYTVVPERQSVFGKTQTAWQQEVRIATAGWNARMVPSRVKVGTASVFSLAKALRTALGPQMCVLRFGV